MAFLIAMVWMMALISGGVLSIGLIALVTGRPLFNMRSEAWTRGEVRKLGAVWSVVGGTYAIYGLWGGIVLGLQLEAHGTNPLIGHWWGFLVPTVPGLVLVGGGLIQLEIFIRHRRRIREGH